jgi:hypothetical protein
VLPIGTKKQTYDVFDTNLNKAVPFAYSGIGDVDGTQAYKFTETVAPTKNGSQTLPGSLVGQSAASVTLPQYYQTQTTYWIDPVTGALLNVTQNEKLTLRNDDGSQALVLFNANLAATQDSIDGLVAIDNDQVSKASLVGTLLPLATGIIGLLLLIIGIALARRPEGDAVAAPSRREPELAAAEPEAAASASLVPGLDDEPREATVESPAVSEAAVREEEATREKAAADAKAAEGAAAASDAKAAHAEARAEDKAAEADAAPASPAAAAEAAEAKTEAAQADAAAQDAQADAEDKAEEAKAEEAKPEKLRVTAPAAPAEETPAAAEARAETSPAEAATAEIPAVDADTAEAPAASDATGETAAQAASSRRRRGTHRR